MPELGALDSALSALSGAPDGWPAIWLDRLKLLATGPASCVLRWPQASRLTLVPAVIAVGSADRVDAVSHAGPDGLMQAVPARRFEIADGLSPDDNVVGGVAYPD